MNVLISLRHSGALRNFASTIRELERRGHAIHLAFMGRDKYGDARLLHEIVRDHPRVTYAEPAEKRAWSAWRAVARGVRFCTDYIRYETPEYAQAHALRERAASRVPKVFVRLCRVPLIKSRPGLIGVRKILEQIERAIPCDPQTSQLLAEGCPDVVLVSPLVDLGSDQVDYIKSARALGIRSGLLVHSWDNLTNKGLMKAVPDRVFVWNEFQKREAVAMHGVAPEHVVVTGAPVYDQWFERRAATTRAEFCARAGLNPDRPFFLYLCSSPFIAPHEAEFVATWVHAIRSAPDARVRESGILVRPHPQNPQPWEALDGLPEVAIWPRAGADPVDTASKDAYFDSMFHAVAAVGINTSAQIECGIAGRPVYTISMPEFAGTQEGTLHFHYLLNANGGLVHLARTLDEHAAQLAGALDRAAAEDEKLRRFVEAFVRPSGLAVAATPVTADAVEALARLPKPSPAVQPAWLLPIRLALYPSLVWVTAARAMRRPVRKRTAPRRGVFDRGTRRALDRLTRWEPIKKFVRRQLVPRVMPRQAHLDASAAEQVAIPRMLQKMARSDRPIVIGPWLGEVGFELLYWIPFLNWATTYRTLERGRLIVVSRGGTGAWYQGVASRYVELFDFFTPEQYRTHHDQRVADGQQKQRDVTDFDRAILDKVRDATGEASFELLHPMHMYRLLGPYWKGDAPVGLARQFARYHALPGVDASDVKASLPDNFVAVRFYFNASFPDTPQNRSFVRALVDTLTEFTDVVLLNPGLRLDDHADLDAHPSQRVHTVDHLMTARNNLDIQTKVISQARAFIGTYGGLSYLAPFYGVNALSFYSHGGGFMTEHLELARRAFGGMNNGSFVALDTSDFNVLAPGPDLAHIAQRVRALTRAAAAAS